MRDSKPPSHFRAELPFTVQFCNSYQDLLDAVEVRVLAYGKREGEENLIDAIRRPDSFDALDKVLIARCKVSSLVLGTVRIHLNKDGATPMSPAVTPAVLAVTSEFFYVDRLAVRPIEGSPQVSIALMKALRLFAGAAGAPPLICVAVGALLTYYRFVGFQLLPTAKEGLIIPGLKEEKYYPLTAAFSLWPDNVRTKRPELYRFLMETHHPDIRV